MVVSVSGRTRIPVITWCLVLVATINVQRMVNYHNLSARSINVKVSLSPVDPSDIHGSYTVQLIPRELTVNREKMSRLPGNERLEEIAEVSPDVKRRAAGSYSPKARVGPDLADGYRVAKVGEGSGVSAVGASTLAVRRSTETRSE